MTEEEVQSTIKTPAVLQAFERIKYDKLPSDVREEYEKEDKEYDRISEYTNSEKEEGKAEGRAEERAKADREKEELRAKAELEKTLMKKEMARKLYKQGVSVPIIVNITNLSVEEVESM